MAPLDGHARVRGQRAFASTILPHECFSHHLMSPKQQPILSIKDLSKTYASGFQALKRINLDIRKGGS